MKPYWDKFNYSPKNFLGWALNSGWKPSILPVGVIYTFQPGPAQMADASPNFVEETDLTVSNARMFMTADGGLPVMIASLNPGSVSMAIQLEHLRFLGDATRYVAIIGTAGALVEGFHFADTAVVTSALRSETISERYLPPAAEVRADTNFCMALQKELGKDIRAVKSWTVTTPYRQTLDEVNQARNDGAEVVEMEIASLYAVAQALDMQAAAAVIISDVSQVDGWKADWSDTVEPTNQSVLKTINVIRSLASNESGRS